MKPNHAIRNLLPASLLTLLFCLAAVELRAAVALARCFSDNMVLQRPHPLTKPDDVLLWGWSERDDKVLVRFGDQKDLKATRVDFPGNPKLKKWYISYGDLKGLPLSPGRFHITVARPRERKSTNDLLECACTNVVFGDVWVIGQRPGLGVPITDTVLKSIRARVDGAVRFLSAPSLNWSNSNVTAAGLAEWREWDDSPATQGALTNVTSYFASQWVEMNPAVPLGIIAVPWDELIPQTVDPPKVYSQDEAAKRAWHAAELAAQQAAADCNPIIVAFPEQILQLKRQGRIPDRRPPLAIIPPTHLHLGNFSSLQLTVRGGIW